jgi:L-seryl-tRNA(Ser) seleniumtransferase
MKRALRCDKMTIAALTALLRLYQQPQQLLEKLPLLRIMTRSCSEIRAQAAALLPLFEQQLAQVASARLVDCASEIGSGALPDHRIASVGIGLRPLPSAGAPDQVLARLAGALRELPVPVIGRVHRGDLLLDCRCLEDVDGFAGQLRQLDLGS